MKGIDWRTIAIFGSIVVSLCSGAYFAGYTVKGMHEREKEIDELRTRIKEVEQEAKEYTDLEVGGLRADWERELKHNKK